MADVKRVYTFGNKEAEGNGKMRELLGGKAEAKLEDVLASAWKWQQKLRADGIM